MITDFLSQYAAHQQRGALQGFKPLTRAQYLRTVYKIHTQSTKYPSPSRSNTILLIASGP